MEWDCRRDKQDTLFLLLEINLVPSDRGYWYDRRQCKKRRDKRQMAMKKREMRRVKQELTWFPSSKVLSITEVLVLQESPDSLQHASLGELVGDVGRERVVSHDSVNHFLHRRLIGHIQSVHLGGVMETRAIDWDFVSYSEASVRTVYIVLLEECFSAKVFDMSYN